MKIIDYYKPDVTSERKKLNFNFKGFWILGILFILFLAWFNNCIFNTNTINICVKTIIPCFFILGVTIAVLAIIVDEKHEHEHVKSMEKSGAKCFLLQKCAIALENHIFSKEDYIKGLKAPHEYMVKQLKKILLALLVFLVVAILMCHNKLYLFIAIEIYLCIAWGLLTASAYSKRISVIDIHYENYLNKLSKTTEIMGIEMILLFDFEDDEYKKYIPYSDDNKKNIIGTKGIRVYINDIQYYN
ncbi:hypothetical protein DVW12_11340 [Clostridium botulinum]|nr:hypothetical protein [Clostridium botulinum]